MVSGLGWVEVEGDQHEEERHGIPVGSWLHTGLADLDPMAAG